MCLGTIKDSVFALSFLIHIFQHFHIISGFPECLKLIQLHNVRLMENILGLKVRTFFRIFLRGHMHHFLKNPVNFVCISSMLLYLSAFHLHNAA